MDGYDPAAPPTLEDANLDPTTTQENSGDEDDDYDPSNSYEEGGNDEQAQQTPASAEPGQSSKPKTVGGFIVEDDEDEEEQAGPPPSQINGTEGAQSGLGAVAVTEAAQDVPIASEPQDTAAATTLAQSAQSTLNGSVPVPVPDFASSVTASADSSLETISGQGKPATPSANASAAHSTTATPQPPAQKLAAPPTQRNGSVTPATQIAQRLPHDKVGQLEDRVKEDPKADVGAWRELIAHYRDKGQLDNARSVYRRFLEVFPSTVSIWIEFIQMELEQNELSRVEGIFNETLLKLPAVDMWMAYIDYLRRVHPLINDTDGSKRSIVFQGFELMLDTVGVDPESGRVWRDYIDFIKAYPGTPGGTGWQDAQKMDLLRKAYQRAIKLPHSELTKLWKEYDNFELGLNKTTGRKFLQEQSPHYMTARAARTQLEQKVEGLDRSSLPTLPPLEGCQGDQHFARQVQLWHSWIAWEKEDPLIFKDEDAGAYQKRILFAYKQATLQLRFYPEIWFDAANWCFDQGTDEMTRSGDEFLDSGLLACPESVLLALKKADQIEGGLTLGNSDDAIKRNGHLIEAPYESVHTALYALHKKARERVEKNVAELQETFSNMPQDDEPEPAPDIDDDDDDDESPRQKPKSQKEQQDEQVRNVRALGMGWTDPIKRAISYVWIAKFRAFRRVQGQGNPHDKDKKGFRGVFAEARPRGQLTSDVYIASALMEWHCYKDPSVRRIFERGLKLFTTDEVFALEYIKHLISVNDHTNARVVFETTLTRIQTPSEKAPLSEAEQRSKCARLLIYMHKFESDFGELEKIHKIEKRMKDLFPHESDLARFAARFTLPAFDALRSPLVLSPTTQSVPKTGPQASPPTTDRTQPAHQLSSPAPAPAQADTSQIRLGPNGPYLASPKRALEDSDTEAPQRKFARGGDSPLKGAAGRRMQNQAHQGHASTPSGGGSGTGMANMPPGGGGGFMTKNYAPPLAQGGFTGGAMAGPAPLPGNVQWIMSMLPKAEAWRPNRLFDSVGLVELLRGVDVSRARYVGGS